MGNSESSLGPTEEPFPADSPESEIQCKQLAILDRLSGGLKIAVALLNKTPFTFEFFGRHWGGGRSAFIDGNPSTTTIMPNKGIAFGGEKNYGLYGVAYLISYKFFIANEKYTLDVAFKVAFKGDNWWNVNVVKGHVQATKQRYDQLRLSSFIATGHPATILLGDNRQFMVTGNQSTVSDCSLTIAIEYKGDRP